MKKLRLILRISVLVMCLYSCGKYNLNSSVQPLISSKLDTLIGKWNVIDSKSGYTSFEFTKMGNYLVVDSILKDKPIILESHFGTYQQNNKNILLSGYDGSIKMSSIDLSSIHFKLTFPNDTDTIVINARKAATLPSSLKTELICGTWLVDSLNGNALDPKSVRNIMFSEYGTYFTQIILSPSIVLNEVAQWVWGDKDSTICTALKGIPTCNGVNEIKILDLSLSKLKYSVDTLTFTCSQAR